MLTCNVDAKRNHLIAPLECVHDGAYSTVNMAIPLLLECSSRIQANTDIQCAPLYWWGSRWNAKALFKVESIRYQTWLETVGEILLNGKSSGRNQYCLISCRAQWCCNMMAGQMSDVGLMKMWTVRYRHLTGQSASLVVSIHMAVERSRRPTARDTLPMSHTGISPHSRHRVNKERLIAVSTCLRLPLYFKYQPKLPTSFTCLYSNVKHGPMLACCLLISVCIRYICDVSIPVHVMLIDD